MGASVQPAPTPPPATDPVADYLAAKQAASGAPASTGAPVDPVADYLAAKAQASAIPGAHDFHAEYASGALGKRMAAENAADAAASAPSEVDQLRARFGGGLAAFDSGTPGGTALVTGLHALIDREPYSEAYKDVQAAEDSSPIKTPLKFAGALPAAMALPGSPVVGGAVIGGADEALDANPNESVAARAARTAGGTALGAIGGKIAQKIGTAVTSFLPSALGGTGGFDANLIARQTARAESAKALYAAAVAEGNANQAGPAIQNFLEEDDIAPIVAKLTASRAGATMDTPTLLDNVYKALSDQERAAAKPLAAVDPSKPNLATNTLANVRAAKSKLLSLLSSSDTKPPLTMSVPEDVTSVEPQITPGHETLTGPPNSGGSLADYTSSEAPDLRQALRNQQGGNPVRGPLPRQGPSGPAFMLRADPGTVVPGVDITTPAMTVQTAPAETLPPMMPSYQKAVQDFAQRSQEINALKRGYQVVQQNAGRTKLPALNSTGVGGKTPLAFATWAQSATPQQLAAARQGITGAVRDAGALDNGFTYKPLRQVIAAAGPLLRSTPGPSQEWLDALRNLGLLEAGNTTTGP